MINNKITSFDHISKSRFYNLLKITFYGTYTRDH